MENDHQGLLYYKRDNFRMKIRRQDHENIFTKKRKIFQRDLAVEMQLKASPQFTQSNGFPQLAVDHCYMINNKHIAEEIKEQSLKELNKFLLDEKNKEIIIYYIDSLKCATQALLAQIDYEPALIGSILVNVTFYFDAQAIKSINGWEHLNLLLNYEDKSPRDSYLTIMANLLVELSSDDQVLFSEKLQIIENVCGSLKAHGGAIDLHIKGLNLINQLIESAHVDYEHVISFLFDIHDNCSKSEVMKACYRCFSSLMKSQMSDVEKGTLLGELKAYDFSENAAHKIRVITSFVENEKIGKKAIAKWLPMILSLVLEQRTIYDLYLLRELFNFGIALDLQENDSFRFFLDELIRLLNVLNNYEAQKIPNSACRFMAAMANGPNFKRLVLEVPVIQLFHRAMQKSMPIPIDQYLDLMKSIISYGEQVEPQKYTGCYIQYRGQLILDHYDNEQHSREIRKSIDQLRDLVWEER